jgi:hypothetical protein
LGQAYWPNRLLFGNAFCPLLGRKGASARVSSRSRKLGGFPLAEMKLLSSSTANLSMHANVVLPAHIAVGVTGSPHWRTFSSSH